MRRTRFLGRRLGVSFLLGLLTLVVTAAPVGAGVGWCRADPIVTINGVPLQIWVSIPDIYEPYVNGPIKVRIAVPEDVTDLQVVHLDAGFNGHGETVIWATNGRSPRADGSIPVKVRIKVPFNKRALRADFGPQVEVPVQAEVVVNGTSEWYEGTHTSFKFAVALTAESESN